MNVLSPHLEFVDHADAVIGKSALPNRELRLHPMGKAPFDESYCALDRNL
jgi:hypothetical protein